MESFGNKIRNARKAMKLTQRELADAIGAKHNSVSDWENDKNKPDPDTIELICGVLDISPSYLLKSSPDDISPSEKILIKKYRDLDSHGKEMVDFTLLKEWERSTSLIEKSNVTEFPQHLEAKAAHNDFSDDAEQQRLMKEDLEEL